MGLVQFSSVVQLCPTLCVPMDWSTPGFPVHNQPPELAQTCVHQIGGAIQPSHPLSSPSSPALNLSQHQVFLQGVFIYLFLAHLCEIFIHFPTGLLKSFAGQLPLSGASLFLVFWLSIGGTLQVPHLSVGSSALQMFLPHHFHWLQKSCCLLQRLPIFILQSIPIILNCIVKSQTNINNQR